MNKNADTEASHEQTAGPSNNAAKYIPVPGVICEDEQFEAVPFKAAEDTFDDNAI